MCEDDDDEPVDHIQAVTEIDTEMIWAVRTGPDSIRVYLNETDTATFTNDAAAAIHAALGPLVSQKPR